MKRIHRTRMFSVVFQTHVTFSEDAAVTLAARLFHASGASRGMKVTNSVKSSLFLASYSADFAVNNGVVTCEINYLFQPSSKSVRNRLISARALKLARNYFKIISEAYCSSRIFSNVFNVAEIILK